MPDHMTPAQRSRAMKRVKLRGGPLERIIHQELRKAGLHFEQNYKGLRGSPDVVFIKEKVAVFIDGDFWHGWRLPAWEHSLTEFWRKKLNENRKRDQRNFRCLRANGWVVIRIWEHQIHRDLRECVEKVLGAL